MDYHRHYHHYPADHDDHCDESKPQNCRTPGRSPRVKPPPNGRWGKTQMAADRQPFFWKNNQHHHEVPDAPQFHDDDDVAGGDGDIF